MDEDDDGSRREQDNESHLAFFFNELNQLFTSGNAFFLNKKQTTMATIEP